MKRRNFLAALAGAFVVDPERALWVAGKKYISIPKQYTMTERPLLIIEMTTAGNDSRLIQDQMFTLKDICTWFKVPPDMMNGLKRPSLDNHRWVFRLETRAFPKNEQ